MSLAQFDNVMCLGCLEPKARIAFDKHGRIMSKCRCGITLFTSNFDECLRGISFISPNIPAIVESVGGMGHVDQVRAEWLLNMRRAIDSGRNAGGAGILTGSSNVGAIGDRVSR
jgi:hypothetical protein